MLSAVYSKSTLNKPESIVSFYKVSFKVIKPVTYFKLGKKIFMDHYHSELCTKVDPLTIYNSSAD